MKALRLGLGVFFLLVVVEGALRKWIFPEQQQIVYLVKDAWLLLLITGHVAARGFNLTRGVQQRGVGLLLVLYVWWVVFESLNPALPSLTLGLWGVRSHILYAALVWLVPAAFPSSEDFQRWLKRIPQLAIPILTLGFVQFFAPLDSPLNRYAAETDYVSAFGEIGAARVTGTFPYISGMTVFVFTVLLVSVVLLLAGRNDRRWPDWLGLTVAAAVIPMTGARWSVYVWLVVLPVLVWEMARAFPAAIARFARVTIGLVIVGGVVLSLADQAITAFAERARGADDEQERMQQVFTEPVGFFEQAGLIGFGVGSTHQAAVELVSDQAAYSWLPTTSFEGESGRLMLELGLIGFLVLMALKVAWIVAAHAALRRARTHAQFVTGLIAMGFFVAHLASPVVFNATAAAFYWGLAGALAGVLREQVPGRATPRVSRVHRLEVARV